MSRVEDPIQSVTLTVKMPNPLPMAVSYDENGRPYPAAGVTYQKLLSIADLVAMGAKLQWSDASGKVMDPDTAKRLIAENEERAANGIVPQQLMAHPHGDHA